MGRRSLEALQGLKKGDTVWIRYHDGKIYKGIVDSFEKRVEGVVTIITVENGYRAAKIADCAFTRDELVA